MNTLSDPELHNAIEVAQRVDARTLGKHCTEQDMELQPLARRLLPGLLAERQRRLEKEGKWVIRRGTVVPKSAVHKE